MAVMNCWTWVGVKQDGFPPFDDTGTSFFNRSVK
jgi:hypothetical protein